MTVITARKAESDAAPVLLYDGEEVAPDALVTMPAWALATALHGASAAAAKDTAQAGVEAGLDLGIQFGYTQGVEAITASKRTRKTVQRDDRGRIESVIEEPVL